MEKHDSVSILASFATLKSMSDIRVNQSPYQILGEFIRHIIVTNNIYLFEAIEIKNRLYETFGFVIPEAVVKTSINNISCVSLNNNNYTVERNALKDDSVFKERKKSAEEDNLNILSMLTKFIEDNDPSRAVREDYLTQELLAFLVDDNSKRNGENYVDLISQFVLKNEKNESVNKALTRIKEGSILYLGLNHDIRETGSLRKPLTLYLGTEVLFSLFGFNGAIYKQLALDFYAQVRAANTPTKKVTLRYFNEVKREIDDFFLSAEAIVDRKSMFYDTVAMKAIINGCSTAADVLLKKADFYHALEHSYGIKEDENQDYYSEDNEKYNLESLDIDPQYVESARLVSHINKLRKGELFKNNLEAKYLIVTNSRNILRFSKEIVEQRKIGTCTEYICDYAVSVDRITNLLWYKLGNGFGRKAYPTNVDAVLKARILLSSRISQNVSKIYFEIKALYDAGQITEDQLNARIIALRDKPIVPEELQSNTIDDAVDFSSEHITRYEETYNKNIMDLQERDNMIRDLKQKNERELYEKDILIAKQTQKIIESDNKNKDLEKEVLELRKEKEEQKHKKDRRKKVVKLIISTIFQLIVLIAVALIMIFFFTKINQLIISNVCNAITIIGAIIFAFKTVKKGIKKCQTTDNETQNIPNNKH